MNLLIFIIALLLVMASISSQALDRYLVGAMARIRWDRYMRVENVCGFNRIVEKEFQSLKRANGKGSTPKRKEEIEAGIEPGIDASSTINFRYLVEEGSARNDAPEAAPMTELIKRLIALIFRSQPFYQKLLQERPNVVDELIGALRQANQQQPEKQRIRQVGRLIQIPLEDPVLQEFWYQLLRTNPADRTLLPFLLQTSAEDALDKEQCVEVSLTRYLNQANKKRIRVYLAPRLLLLAIFQDEIAVAEVVKLRRELFREVKNKKKELKDASDEFERACQSFTPLGEIEPILNFQVTTTNPAYYEN